MGTISKGFIRQFPVASRRLGQYRDINRREGPWGNDFDVDTD
jgi:hypothetical protein|tara:strand:+ start:1120 stop:1245 length:126 start_codon:yes stop_codon:yes gene_type:complete